MQLQSISSYSYYYFYFKSHSDGSDVLLLVS
jgi:hypothetical protein